MGPGGSATCLAYRVNTDRLAVVVWGVVLGCFGVGLGRFGVDLGWFGGGLRLIRWALGCRVASGLL